MPVAKRHGLPVTWLQVLRHKQKHDLVTTKFGPPPHPPPPKLTKIGLFWSVFLQDMGKQFKTTKFSKSALPQEDAQKTNFSEFGWGRGDPNVAVI